jgi:hypothetical protein
MARAVGEEAFAGADTTGVRGSGEVQPDASRMAGKRSRMNLT